WRGSSRECAWPGYGGPGLEGRLAGHACRRGRATRSGQLTRPAEAECALWPSAMALASVRCRHCSIAIADLRPLPASLGSKISDQKSSAFLFLGVKNFWPVREYGFRRPRSWNEVLRAGSFVGVFVFEGVGAQFLL